MVVIFDIRHNNLRLITVAWTSNKIAQAPDDRTDIKPKGIVHEAGKAAAQHHVCEPDVEV